MAFAFSICIGFGACSISVGQRTGWLELLRTTGSAAIADVPFLKQIPCIRIENNGPESPDALTIKNGLSSTCESSSFKFEMAASSGLRDISRLSQNRIDRPTLLSENVRLQI
jgi:hypothetical protein